MPFGRRSALCFVNWDAAASMVDDGSYVNWVEGTRVLEAAIEILPIDVSRIDTGGAPSSPPHRLSPADAIAALRADAIDRVLIAGNIVELDVVPFAIALAQIGIEAILLFDVCGTRDPMAKWPALARAVDEGVTVSTVQQTIGMLNAEAKDPDLRSRLSAVLRAELGEHARELSAA